MTEVGGTNRWIDRLVDRTHGQTEQTGRQHTWTDNITHRQTEHTSKQKTLAAITHRQTGRQNTGKGKGGRQLIENKGDMAHNGQG
jgi:hypothetical protein